MSDPEVITPDATFLAAAEDLGLAFEPGDLERLGTFLHLLTEANRSINLTAARNADELWHRHILDSLTLLPLVAEAAAQSLIDIGSGGGFPGLPLAIVQPALSVTLIEATGKKARFLETAARELNLTNLTVVNERAETAGQDRERFRERFDVVTARAVGRLPVLVELTVPFARVGGLIFVVKGEQALQEIAEARQALHRLHTHVIDTVRTPTGTIVVLEKQRKTPRIYPRRPGEPRRSPLR